MIDNSYLEKKGEKKKSKQRKKRKKENGFQPAGVEEGEKRSGLPENGEKKRNCETEETEESV